MISFEGGNVRLVQMGVALKHLSHVINEVASGAPLVFCGDFNSTPNTGNSYRHNHSNASNTSTSEHLVKHVSLFQQCLSPGCVCLLVSGVVQLVSEAAVPQEHADWSSSGPEESCSMELLSTFPPLLSACNQPAYTNYVGGFHGCLDYIFIQPNSMQVIILLLLILLLQYCYGY